MHSCVPTYFSGDSPLTAPSNVWMDKCHKCLYLTNYLDTDIIIEYLDDI